MKERIQNFFSLTRTPFAFTQTLFIILGFLYAGGADFLKLFLAVITLGPVFIYGGIYMLNDVADREFDRQHPKKRHRVITSEKINVGTAVAMSVILIAIGFTIASYIGVAFTIICFLVLLNNLIYSFRPRLKDHLYLGLLSCSLNYPLRFLAGSSLISLSSREVLPALLFFFVALNGFSAYRIYDIKSMEANLREKHLREELNLVIAIRGTALTVILITLVIQYERAPLVALGTALYMLLFSEINLRIVRHGIDLFHLLRVQKTLREKPELIYYPAMVGILAVLIVYIILKSV